MANLLLKRRSSAANLGVVIPDSDEDRRVSLTGYSNLALDVTGESTGNSTNNGLPKPRVTFAESPQVALGVSGLAVNTPTRRKYSDAMLTLKPFRPSSTDGKLPINNVGLFSYIFVNWLSPFIWKMFRHRNESVSESDVWQCSEQEGLQNNADRLCRLWEEEVARKGPERASLLRVWFRFIFTRMLFGSFLITILALSSFMSSAFIVNKIVAYIESPGYSLEYGLGLVAAMLTSDVTRACAFCSIIVVGAQTGTRFRSAFMGMMYRKLLRLRTVKASTNSEIISIFTVDSYRVYLVSWTFMFLVAAPIYMIIGTVYCYTMIGLWCFLPLGIFTVCYCAQSTLTKVLEKLRRVCSRYTTQRVKRMGEVLNNMKFIKMYAWHKPFEEAIQAGRKTEQQYLLYSAMVSGIVGSIIPISPTLASVITMSVYAAVGYTFTASTAFAILGTMNFLRAIVAFIPFSMRSYGEAKISFERMQKLLLLEEFTEPSPECFDNANAVEIKGSNFAWDPSGRPAENGNAVIKKTKKSSSIASSRRESINLFILTDINVEIKRGRLLGICGPVGSGKSSLMNAVLGRMPMIKGHLAVAGHIAYVAQQAWIFNGSLKDNILFGLPYDANRYQETISVCSLETDIEMLVDGDETEIGERGANLSGGQKQRVNLARAVYSDSDVYVVDDPMSALDARVGKQIFHKCIRRHLAGKTILLVTHQLQYLKHCDEVMVMDEGEIVGQGTHAELLTNNDLYSDMFKIFDFTSIKQLKTTDDDGNDTDKKVEVSEGLPPAFSFIRKKPKVQETAKKNTTQQQNGHAKTNGKHKGKLIEREEATVGDISLDVYLSYIRAAGGWLVAILVVLLYFCASGTVVFSDWWLSTWIDTLSQPGIGIAANSSNISDLVLNASTSVLAMHVSTAVLPSNTSTMTTTALPSNTSTMMDTIEASGGLLDNLSYNTFLLVYGISVVGVILIYCTKGCVGAKIYISASNALHSKCLDKVMKAPMSFFDSNPAGRILNRFSKDLDEGDVFLPQMLDSFMQIGSLSLLSMAMAVFVSPWIIIAVIPVMCLFVALKTISSVSVRQLKRLENVSRSPLVSHVNTTSQGLSTIVAYRQQGQFLTTCESLGDVASMMLFLFEVSMRWIGIRLDITASMITFSTALIFVITKGSISPAMAGLVLGLCGKIVSIMQFVIRLINELEARFTSIERLHEYGETLASESQHAEKTEAADWPRQGGLVFKDVVMSYRVGMDPVLRKVSFDILPGEKVGVVGRTGAGKSSLAVALFRLAELREGHIYVDGEDLAKLDINVVRSRISTIPQDPVLFNGTVRYNIDPFSVYSDEAVWNALERVHMKEKILQFEDEGLDAMIDENGENFSVGERQLLCLARAVLMSNKILLLDEATANIDTSTDAMIQETIRSCFADCTVITIAHRLNTVLHSDKIIVLDAGEVMECASPQDLLANSGSFFNALISAQSALTPSP